MKFALDSSQWERDLDNDSGNVKKERNPFY